jgi:hypothetical protein
MVRPQYFWVLHQPELSIKLTHYPPGVKLDTTLLIKNRLTGNAVFRKICCYRHLCLLTIVKGSGLWHSYPTTIMTCS